MEARKQRLRRHAMKTKEAIWFQGGGKEEDETVERYTCRGCRRRYKHRSSLNRHLKECLVDKSVKLHVKRKLKLQLGDHYCDNMRKPPLPKPPKRRGRPPHIISRCRHCPRTFHSAVKKRDHQRYCLTKQRKNIVKIVEVVKNGGDGENGMMMGPKIDFAISPPRAGIPSYNDRATLETPFCVDFEVQEDKKVMKMMSLMRDVTCKDSSSPDLRFEGSQSADLVPDLT